MKSKRAFSGYDFFRAVAILGKIVTEAPEFENNDSARIMIAKSLMHFDFSEAPRKVIDSIWVNPFADSLLPRIQELEFEIAVYGNSIEAPYIYQAINSLGANDGMRGNIEYLMGRFYLCRGENEKAKEHFLLVEMGSENYQAAQRDLKVATYLYEKKQSFQLADIEVINRYNKLRSEHDELGLKVLELISTHETSYTIMELSEIEKQINQNLVLIEQYKQAVEDEKNRLLKLLGE